MCHAAFFLLLARQISARALVRGGATWQVAQSPPFRAVPCYAEPSRNLHTCTGNKSSLVTDSIFADQDGRRSVLQDLEILRCVGEGDEGENTNFRKTFKTTTPNSLAYELFNTKLITCIPIAEKFVSLKLSNKSLPAFIYKFPEAAFSPAVKKKTRANNSKHKVIPLRIN